MGLKIQFSLLCLLLRGATCVAAEGEDMVDPDNFVLLWRLKNLEMLKNLDSLLGHLSPDQWSEFLPLFSYVLTCSDVIEHNIDVDDACPIKQRFYHIPPAKQKVLEAEVQYLIENMLA